MIYIDMDGVVADFASPYHLLIDDRSKVVGAFIGEGGAAHLFEPSKWKEALAVAIEFAEGAE